MNRWKIAAITLAALCAFQAAWIAGPALFEEAQAQDPTEDSERAPTAPNPEQDHGLLCKLFETDVQQGSLLETSDRTTEVGQWVGEQEDAGWRFHSVDFEVGQKPTGYPQGYLQVCLVGR
jgi:hypothetical protein